MALKVRLPAVAILAKTASTTVSRFWQGREPLWVPVDLGSEGFRYEVAKCTEAHFCVRKYLVDPVTSNKEDSMGAIRELEVAIRTSVQQLRCLVSQRSPHVPFLQTSAGQR